MKSIEIEKKQLINKEIYLLCCEKLKKKFKPCKILQINHYYDTSDFHIASRNETIRVRQIKNILTLERKFNKKCIDNISVCEENATVIESLPHSIKMNGVELHCIGSMVTFRTNFIFSKTTISLDESYYQGVVDYEIEIESDNCEKLPDELKSIVNFSSSPPGKYKRFVRMLKKANGKYEL